MTDVCPAPASYANTAAADGQFRLPARLALPRAALRPPRHAPTCTYVTRPLLSAGPGRGPPLPGPPGALPAGRVQEQAAGAGEPRLVAVQLCRVPPKRAGGGAGVKAWHTTCGVRLRTSVRRRRGRRGRVWLASAGRMRGGAAAAGLEPAYPQCVGSGRTCSPIAAQAQGQPSLPAKPWLRALSSTPQPALVSCAARRRAGVAARVPQEDPSAEERLRLWVRPQGQPGIDCLPDGDQRVLASAAGQRPRLRVGLRGVGWEEGTVFALPFATACSMQERGFDLRPQ